MEQTERFAAKGFTWHRNQFYSFFVPLEWHRFYWGSDYKGDIYGPDRIDPLTIFVADTTHLQTSFTEKDLDALQAALLESIQHLSNIVVECVQSNATSHHLELDVKYHFEEFGVIRKCWTRMFYHETRQITMTAQGANPEAYECWLPCFLEIMVSAQVHSQKPECSHSG